MLTKLAVGIPLAIGMLTLPKVASSPPAISIGVIGSSVKTEVSSPEKVLQLNTESYGLYTGCYV